MIYKKLKAFGIITISATMAGCVVATPIITPSGQQGFTIDCSAMNNIGYCYKKAGELCGGSGYEVFDQNNKPVTFWSGANQTMVVRCKSPQEAAQISSKG